MSERVFFRKEAMEFSNPTGEKGSSRPQSEPNITAASSPLMQRESAIEVPQGGLWDRATHDLKCDESTSNLLDRYEMILSCDLDSAAIDGYSI